MKPVDPLAKLLEAAARAPRKPNHDIPQMSLGWETRVLAAARTASSDIFSFLPLFRTAAACAAVIALASASLHFKNTETTDVYDYALNHSLALAYLE